MLATITFQSFLFATSGCPFRHIGLWNIPYFNFSTSTLLCHQQVFIKRIATLKTNTSSIFTLNNGSKSFAKYTLFFSRKLPSDPKNGWQKWRVLEWILQSRWRWSTTRSSVIATQPSSRILAASLAKVHPTASLAIAYWLLGIFIS